ncbi:hypothetical protein RHECNPAF_12210022 [Rhizobium etli CNPAF512]|nr:hypothetical protein RHECNPAF_12210022 [Rhizobium etli CNPAF512]
MSPDAAAPAARRGEPGRGPKTAAAPRVRARRSGKFALSSGGSLQNIDHQSRKAQGFLDHSKHQHAWNDRDLLPPDEGKAGPERAFGKPGQDIGRQQRRHDDEVRLFAEFGELLQADRLKSPVARLALPGIIEADAVHGAAVKSGAAIDARMPLVDEIDDGDRRRRQAFYPVAQPIERGVGASEKCFRFLTSPDHGAEAQRFGVGAAERLAILGIDGEGFHGRDPRQFLIHGCKKGCAEDERWPQAGQDFEIDLGGGADIDDA